MVVEPFREPRWVDLAISRLLRGGVVISISVVIAGLILTFVHHPEYLSSKPALGELTAVALAPDLGERYLDTVYQANWVQDLYGYGVLEEQELTDARWCSNR